MELTLMSMILVSNILFYIGVHKIARYGTADYDGWNSKKCWRWRNTVTSLVHATISAIFSAICVIDNVNLVIELIDTHSQLSAILITSSAGYFIWDTIDLLLNDGLNQWEIYFHHVAIAFTFPLCILINSCHGFPVSALLIEWNTIFLHSRRLLKMSDVDPTHPVAVVNKVLLASTLLLFRFLLPFYIVNYHVANYARIPSLLYVTGSFGAVVMISINVGLAHRIYKSDYCRKIKK